MRRLLLASLLFGTLVYCSQSKVDKKFGPLLSTSFPTHPLSTVDIFITFDGIQKALAQAEREAKGLRTKESRTTLIYKTLKAKSEASKTEVLDFLRSRNIPRQNIKSFWINNKVFIKDADSSLIRSLAELPSVTQIEKDYEIFLTPPIVHGPPNRRVQSKEKDTVPLWNIEKMGAHLVWEQRWGNNGTGVVVGFIDTGVRGTHEAIRDQYRNDGRSWRDPYNEYDVPTDIFNHGTHTVGSVLGKFGIGSAPGAQWIACKGYRDNGGASLAAFFECGQFMICPTDANGQNPDCSKTPHLTSNSWGVHIGTYFFEDVLDVWNAVGIISVFSNGNHGPFCGNMLAPADSTKTMGVGATGYTDNLPNWSSRGPSSRGAIKPDISAPGWYIGSCDSRQDDLYIVMSGTSMSCPNAAGITALMIGKDPRLTPARAKAILQITAERNVTSTNGICGVPNTVVPNNHFGYGRINGFSAVQLV